MKSLVSGLGVPPVGATPIDDALSQLTTVQTYMTASLAGTATGQQLTDAQTALANIALDLQTLKAAPPAGNCPQVPQGVWVTGTAAGAMAAGAGLLGAVGGFFFGRRKR